jgi:hypothetical protein
MGNEITIIDSKDFGLTEDKAIQITQSFLPKIAEFNGYIEVYNLIITEDITEETISKANSLRKKLVKVRTGIADVHKAEKAFYLASGKYIDALKNKHTLPVLQMEEKLEEVEQYFINIENERLKILQLNRIEILKPFEVENVENLRLNEMDDIVFESFLIGCKTKFEAKKEDENERLRNEKEENERKEAERLAEIEEQKRILAENKKLEAEKLAIQELAKVEREKAEQILANERKLANEKAILEANKMKALQDELESKAKVEREKAEQILLIEKQKIENEIKAQKAPLKTKMKNWVTSFSISESPIENEVTKEIESKFTAFKNWALTQIDKQ